MWVVLAIRKSSEKPSIFPPQESASDMSPYVRKTAAVAIPKMYSLDPEQKEECVQVIEKLLADRTTLVAGALNASCIVEILSVIHFTIHIKYNRLYY